MVEMRLMCMDGSGINRKSKEVIRCAQADVRDLCLSRSRVELEAIEKRLG